MSAKKEMPREVRELWQEQRQAELDIPGNYRRKWSDGDIEKVVTATPDKYPSYWDLAHELNRSPGALHRVKQIVIELLEQRPYAVEMAESGNPKRNDYSHVYRILKDKCYLSLPENEWREFACHLSKPNSGWRGDHTQAVLARRRGNSKR
jgi:hypothetical protein